MRFAAGSQVAQHWRAPSPDRVFLVARSLREVAAEEHLPDDQASVRRRRSRTSPRRPR